MKDLVYYFDKLSPYTRHELGEIQADFNMSFTIDGTKDSTKIIVHSFSGVEIEPYTILKHEKTSTWWCVIKDKVDRYENENNASNQKSFYYIHTITCNGARELLNARDLTDSGFNTNRYTIDEFLKRLVSLSKWDFANVNFVYGNNIDFYNYVEFIKAFENYTLYSALREFLDSYNCDFKLTYDQNANGSLNNAYITIIPKSGNVDLDTLQESVFGDVRESKLIDKNSFGTIVVSNAENVVSSVAKTFPSQGSARASSTEYEIKYDNAVFRLPTPIYKLNWFKLYYRLPIYIKMTPLGSQQAINLGVYIYPSNQDSVENLSNLIKNAIENTSEVFPIQLDEMMSEFDENLDLYKEMVTKIGTITFYEGNSLNPSHLDNSNPQQLDPQIVKGTNVPYIPILNTRLPGTNGTKDYKFVIMDKDQRNCLPLKEQGFYWERGSNLIQGFDMFQYNITPKYGTSTDWGSNETDLFEKLNVPGPHGAWNISIYIDLENTIITLPYSYFSCNYIPMSDLKIEIDNQRSTKDMQLYNQNGKLTDSVALSKILNSYSREISSDKITKYMDFYDFSDIPQVGQLVNINNELYVINNVSIDFFLNEDDSYYMPCEFTLCKYTSTKSLMVNPNTNIRDYGIPQNYNVKRKQLYRDYLELSYTQDSNASGTFYSKVLPLDLENNSSGYIPVAHTCLIRCYYQNEVDNSHTWYYQLETTIFRLEKVYIELLDFNDNNIIGYGSQNSHEAFDISKIFRGYLTTINTPISYVDDNGEVLDFEIRYVDNEQLGIIWKEYQDSTAYSGDDSYDLANFSVFIPATVFTDAELRCDIDITAHDYKKDAIEVPVFEYVFQIGDSDDVLIGDKILNNVYNEEDSGLDYVYLYGFVMRDSGTLNQLNATKYAQDISIDPPIGMLTNACDIDNSNSDYIYISLYEWGAFSTTNFHASGGMVLNNEITPTANKDYAIFRYKYSVLLGDQIGDPELVMVLKNVPSSAIDSDTWLKVYKNKYKLK